MISRLAVIIEHTFIPTIQIVVNFYQQFENLKVIFFAHSSLENNVAVKDLIEKKQVVFCNENDIFVKIVSFLKEEPNTSGYCFQNFVLNPNYFQSDFVFVRKNENVFDLVVGKQEVWEKIYSVMSKCCESFDFVRKNSSVYLFSNVVNVFFDDGIDLKDKVYYCEKNENILEIKDKQIINTQNI